MTGTGSLARAIASLESGGSVTEALAILRVLRSCQPVAGLSIDEYAEELEVLSKQALAQHAACATAQARLALQKLAHVRAELAQLRELDGRDTPTLPSPAPDSGDAT